jgi:hypothetical protein
MNCVLCGETSIQAKIERFPFSTAARKMLQKRFGIEADEALAICHRCLVLPGNLAENALEREQHEHQRDLIIEVLRNSRN